TGTTLGRLGEQETIWAAAHTLRGWIERYGVPQALYVDWKNLYQRPPTQCERLRGEAPITQFGRMCAKLGIGLMAAGSPQAKGRVERNHGTHQDRLVKKLRRQNIRTHEQANAYLHREYLPEHNRRFARPAAAPENYHRAAPSADQLRKIFRLESERTISNDWVVRYQGRFFQLQRAPSLCARAGPSVGLRVAGWDAGDRISRADVARAGDRHRSGARSSTVDREVGAREKVRSPTRPPVAARLRTAPASCLVRADAHGRSGCSLRFALSASPPAPQGFAPAATRTKNN